MNTLDSLMGKVYDKNKYNCAHFTIDVWKVITGEDITEAFKGLLEPLKYNKATMSLREGFKRLKEPVNPCIVLMNRKGSTPHVGVWYNGKVLHLTESGAIYAPLDVAMLGFKQRRFYKC